MLQCKSKTQGPWHAACRSDDDVEELINAWEIGKKSREDLKVSSARLSTGNTLHLCCGPQPSLSARSNIPSDHRLSHCTLIPLLGEGFTRCHSKGLSPLPGFGDGTPGNSDAAGAHRAARSVSHACFVSRSVHAVECGVLFSLRCILRSTATAAS